MPSPLNTTSTIQLGSSGPTLNTVDANGVVWRVDQNGLVGWDGRPGTNLTPTQRVRARGTWTGKAFSKGRDITVSGTITAPTPDLLNAAAYSLEGAVTSDAFTFTVTASGTPSWALVKRSGDTVVQKVSNLHAAYSIAVHADDPRKFGAPLTGSTFLPSSTGGLTWPHTWPEKWTATTVSGTVSLTNPGNTAGVVILRVDGPCTGPQITHRGVAGAAITFDSSLVLGSGEWLTINMDTHQTLANDQANRAQYITSAGWSEFDPGANLWAFAAAVPDPASKLTVTAWPAN